jgi:hypothetical protein
LRNKRLHGKVIGAVMNIIDKVFANNETWIGWSEGSVSGSERAKHVDICMHSVRKHFVHEAWELVIFSFPKL